MATIIEKGYCKPSERAKQHKESQVFEREFMERNEQALNERKKELVHSAKQLVNKNSRALAC